MKKTVVLLLILFVSKGVYASPFMDRCQANIKELSERITSFRIKRELGALTYAGQKRRVRILMSLLNKKLTPRVQMKVAKLSADIRGMERFDVLKELLKQDPPLEVRTQIIYSTYDSRSNIMRRGILFLEEEFLEQRDLSPDEQNEMINVAQSARNREGFDLLKKMSEKYPSLEVQKAKAYVASKIRDVDLFKELLEEEPSMEMQLTIAFYAGNMKGPDGLSILELLKGKDLSIEQLQFAFLAGKAEANGVAGFSSRSSSGFDTSGAMVAAMGAAAVGI